MPAVSQEERALSDSAKKRLFAQWGSYDFRLIRDKQFVSAEHLLTQFVRDQQSRWSQSPDPLDRELLNNIEAVRRELEPSIRSKVTSIIAAGSEDTLRTHIMFKQLHYGDHDAINFGSVGTNWKKKAEIAEELSLYRPWSVEHAAAHLGGIEQLREHMLGILQVESSRAAQRFFDAWWNLTQQRDRPMLFPKVWGHTSGKFWSKLSETQSVPLRFDFGLVNVERGSKILVDCGAEALTDERRKTAEENGWVLTYFSRTEAESSPEASVRGLSEHLKY